MKTQPDEHHFHHLAAIWGDLWKLPDRRPPWQWCEDFVKVDPSSAFPGFWKSSRSPWLRPIMEAAADSSVRSISLMTSAQSAKTQFLICILCWVLAEDPGPGMWATANNAEMKFFRETRLFPTLKECAPLVKIMEQQGGQLRGTDIGFPGAPFFLTGAQSPSALQSKPARWLFLDEIRSWPEGAVEMAEKRARTWWNHKIFKTSTADKEADAIHRAFLEGDQNVWNVPCMSCGEFGELMWENVRWDKAIQAEGGGVDFDRLFPTIRYHCPQCDHPHADTPAVRRHFTNKGKFIPRNPKGPKEHRSYHWNALLPTWVKWSSLVAEFILAHDALKFGDTEPLKDFINQSLGQPWEDRLGSVGEKEIVHDRQRDYNLGDPWSVPHYRILTADKQAKGGTHYWFAVRDWAADGSESRLTAYGRVTTDAELIDAANTYNVNPSRRFVDCGYDWAAVLRFCLENGWHPLRGDPAKHFLVRPPGSRKTVRQSWTASAEPVNFGISGHNPLVEVIRWSNLAIKDMLAELSQGLAGNWTLPRDISEEYMKQFTAEHRVERTRANGTKVVEWRKKAGRDDHLRDCELMQLVAALAMNILHTSAPSAADGEGEDTVPTS